MDKKELLKQCKFYKGGGEAEARSAYETGGDFLVCWVGESLWVKHGGVNLWDSSKLDLLKGVDLQCETVPSGMVEFLADSLIHFNHSLFYEGTNAEFISALRSILSFYANFS